jgi:prophage antirepressor-like protein
MELLPQIFDFQSARVRVVIQDGEPWFVAKDVCNILDLEQISRVMDRLDDDERGLLKVTHPQNPDKLLEVNVVTESGLYQLVIASNKPEAKSFKRWITHEVIPAIRKSGLYQIQPKTQAEVSLQIAQCLVDQEKKIFALEETQGKQAETIQNIKEAIITTDKDWRRGINKKLQRIGFQTGDYQGIKNESYELLEKRGHCNLDRRLENLRSRLREAATTKTQINSANYLDVIETEPRLKEIYTSIVRELSVKHVA